jgi:hypothetical protein
MQDISSNVRVFFLFSWSNHIINIKIIIFFFRRRSKRQVIFPFFIFCFIRELNLCSPLVSISQIINQSKPILPPCAMNPPWIRHSSAHSWLRRRRRRILLACFANAKPLPEAGNNYLGSECDHLPEAVNIYIGIHSSAHPSAHTLWAPPKAANVAKLIRRRRISLKRDNHPPTLLSARWWQLNVWMFNPSQKNHSRQTH